MAARSIDGPEKTLLSTEEAVAWIGMERKLFLRAARDTDWCRPVKVGRRTFWGWLDLVVLNHVLAKKEEKQPAKEK